MEQEQTTQEEESTSPDTAEINEHADSEEYTERAEASKSEESVYSHVQQETVSGAAISGHGPMHVTINYHYGHASQDIRQAWERPYEEESDEEDNETAQGVLKKNIRFARQNRTLFDTPLPAHDTSSSETPPDDEDSLSEQYYKFEEYARCYVLAVALLHGATAREIYRRTDELYRLTLLEQHNTLQQMTSQQDSSSSQTGQAEILPSLPPFAFPRQATRLDLQKQTWTLSYRENGAERLFWYDVTLTGQSFFETRMLTFLAKECNRKGEHWDGFFKLVRSWSVLKRGSRMQKGNTDESSWRSARALGAILWHQNTVELRQLAEEWAKKDSFAGRKLAASLLHGAYEVEQLTLAQETQSAIHQLLQEWIVRLQRISSHVNINLGCSVASTYGLIVSGNDTADTTRTLHHLDDLLRLQKYGQTRYVQQLAATVSSTYVSLSLAGQIRPILSHLAGITEELVYSWELPRKLQDRDVLRWQRELRLDTALDAFFLIATTVRSQRRHENQWDSTSSKYLQPLEASVPLPDTDGRDILLVGLLTEDTLAKPLMTLLCAAMFAKRSKHVSELLTRWASIVFAIEGIQQLPDSIAYTRFVTFLLNLGHLIRTWSYEIQRHGYRQPVAYEAYRQQLQGWIDNKRNSNSSLTSLGIEILDCLEHREMSYKQPGGRAI